MTITIRELTDKFYEVIDFYHENESTYLNDDLTMKTEYKAEARAKFEKLLSSFSDSDDLSMAFAAYCTVVVRYDLIDDQHESYFYPIKEAIDKIIPDKESDVYKVTRKVCEVICNNNYADYWFFDESDEMWDKMVDFTVIQLYTFVFLFWIYTNTEFEIEYDYLFKDYKKNYKCLFKILCNVYELLDIDLSDYIFGEDEYSRKCYYPSAVEKEMAFGTSGELLPYLYIGSLRDLKDKTLADVLDIESIYELCKKLEEENIEKTKADVYRWQLNNKLYRLKAIEDIKEENFGKWFNYIPKLGDRIFNKNQCLHIPVIIPDINTYHQLFDDGYKLQKKNNKLKKMRKKLNKSVDDKYNLLNTFTHKYKIASTSDLNKIAKYLLSSDDMEAKLLGKKALLECSIKNNMTTEIKMLNLRFKDEKEELIRKIKDSVYSIGDEYFADGENIAEILKKALGNCLTMLIHDGSEEPTKIRKYCFKDVDFAKLETEYDVNIIQQENDIIDWFRKHIMYLETSVSSEWNDIAFGKNSFASLLICDLMHDLIVNAFKYADRVHPLAIDFFTDDSNYIITAQNHIRNGINIEKVPSTGFGIKSENDIFKIINKANNDSVIVTKENGCFKVMIYIDKSTFNKKE